jgi:hypothetical protein
MLKFLPARCEMKWRENCLLRRHSSKSCIIQYVYFIKIVYIANGHGKISMFKETLYVNLSGCKARFENKNYECRLWY